MYLKNFFRQTGFGLLLISLFSCASKKLHTAILAQLDSSLVQANAAAAESNSNLIAALKNKVADPETQSKGQVWLPKANKADPLAQSFMLYIDGLKTELTKQQFTNGAGTEAVQKLFLEKGQGRELYTRLLQYKTNLTAVDDRVKDVPEAFLPINRISNNIHHTDDFRRQFFSSATPSEATAFLSSLQNTVLGAENKLLRFFINQITADGFYDANGFEAIVAQNAKVLTTGDYLEITAGLGNFKASPSATFTIGGKNIWLNEKGIAFYRCKTSKRAGNYSLPVTAAFVDQDGKEQTRAFSVTYRLVDSL